MYPVGRSPLRAHRRPPLEEDLAMVKTPPAGSPLTRYGSRVPTISPTTANPTPNVIRTPAEAPTATIRTRRERSAGG
jgi:hypothetical protein